MHLGFTLLTFSCIFQHAFGATLSAFQCHFEHALDASWCYVLDKNLLSHRKHGICHAPWIYVFVHVWTWSKSSAASARPDQPRPQNWPEGPRYFQIAGEWMVTRSLPKDGNNRSWPIAICDFYQCNIDTVSILGSKPVRSDPCDQVWLGPPEQAELRMVCLLWIRLGLNLQHILRQHLGLLPKRISMALLKVLKRGFMEGFCHDTFNNVIVLFSWLRLSKIAASWLRVWPQKSCLKLHRVHTCPGSNFTKRDRRRPPAVPLFNAPARSRGSRGGAQALPKKYIILEVLCTFWVGL